VRVRDIRLLGGLRERLDQVLSYLDSRKVPVDEWDTQFAWTLMSVNVKKSTLLSGQATG